MKTEVHILLNNWLTCRQTFLNRVKQEMLFIAPGVPEGALFTTKLLCSEEFYSPLSKWEKTLAGACVDYLAESGDIPFENVPRTGRNPYPLQYRIKV